MAQRIGDLPVGSKVKFINHYGQKLQWIVLGHNVPNMPSGSTMLWMAYVDIILPFDAKESGTGSNRQFSGNNDWKLSNLRQWANSSGAANAWFTKQHANDNPPTAQNVDGGHNPYVALPGFLYEATADEKDALMDTTRYFGRYKRNFNSPCTDKVFLLTATEAGYTTGTSGDGALLPCFSANTVKKDSSTVTALCLAHYTPNYSLRAGDTCGYWFCTSDDNLDCDVCSLDRSMDGKSLNYGTTSAFTSQGVRFACNVKSDTKVGDSTDADGCYTVTFNQPPSAPSTITVPAVIKSAESYQVSWAKASDPDGNLEGYILQRALNGTTTYTQVYKGSALTFTDNLTFGTTEVQYRVQAYDSQNATSGWTTSDKKGVVNNHPPVISGTDKSIGNFTSTPPKFDYTVTDEDNDIVTVEEYIDGTRMKSYAAELGVTKSMTYSAADWQQVLNGTHTFKVVATDAQKSSVTRTVTFTKTINAIEFTLASPLTADAMPTKAIFNVKGSFPSGSTLQVMACNNGNDASPTWQDVTQAVQTGAKVFFTNQTKTANTWAVNLKVKITRGTAQGDVYITSIGGNFR